MTMEDKVSKSCPHFDRMHVLYGERANVAPPALGEFGLGDDVISTQEFNREAEDEAPIDRPATPTEILPENVSRDGPLDEDDKNVWNTYPTVTDAANEIYEGDVTQATKNSPEPSAPSCAPAPNQSTPARNSAATPSTRSGLGAAGQSNPPCGTAGLGRPIGPGAPPRNRNSPPAVSSTKTNMASVYQEKLSQKVEYLRDMADNKRKWKEAELKERREARMEACVESARRKQKARLHALKLEIQQQLKAEQRAKADRDHALQLLRTECKTQLLLELFRSNKTQDEVIGMIKLIDHLD